MNSLLNKSSNKTLHLVGFAACVLFATQANATLASRTYGASITAGKSNTSATYQAVTEQSGIKTGDGGFQITVGGKTTLTGAVITSTQAAVDGKDKDANGQTKPLNSFTSAGGVSATDLTNTAGYKATSSSITAGVGSSLSSSGAGTGNAKGNETTITQSGISGVTVTNTATGATVNNTVRTDDKAPVLASTFAQNKDAIKANVGAQVQITQQFGQAASKAIGDLGDKKLAEAKTLKDQAAALASTDPAKAAALTAQANDIESNWKEGGTLRVLAHTLTGGLTGNLSGAAGAATSQTLVPMLGEQLKDSALPLELKQGLLQIAAIAIGTAAGGGSVAGAAAAQNATANNCLAHKCESIKWDTKAPGYHKYDPIPSQTLCNISQPGCLDAVKVELASNSAPGQEGTNLPGQTRRDVDLTGPGNYVSQFLAPDGMSIINGTEAGKHMFDDGYIKRAIVVDKTTGNVTIVTSGEGINKPLKIDGHEVVPAEAMKQLNLSLGTLLFQQKAQENWVNIQVKMHQIK